MELTTKADAILCNFKDLGGFCVSSFLALGIDTLCDPGKEFVPRTRHFGGR